jgi:uncharacterized protein (DUF302 family)
MNVATDTQPTADPRYGHTVHLAGVDYATARERIIEALKGEGFGVLTEIDVKDTLQKKIGAEFRRYTILGACNPQLAHRGLQAELGLGLLLPCNVCVWEEDDGSAIAVLRPDTMVQMATNPALQPIADEADARLRRALATLRVA